MVAAKLPDGGEAVLKVYVDEHQAEALARWGGRGAVRVLARDDEHRAVLLERCHPGRQLWSLPDRQATEIAADVLEQLWVPADTPFRRLEERAATWAETVPNRPVEEEVADRVVAFLREAGPTQRESVLLHQDLHGGNVLESERGWLAIDAQPLVGEREFDVASLIRDRRPATKAQLEWRLDYLVERLELDPERTRGWAIAHALAWNGSPEMVDCASSLAT